MIWLSFSDDEDNVIKVNENEKILRRFKKAKDFDKLNIVVKERNDYKNTKYKSNEKEVQDESREMKNLIVLND